MDYALEPARGAFRSRPGLPGSAGGGADSRCRAQAIAVEGGLRMNGETDLKTLLATMQPVLDEEPYVFCSLSQEAYHQLPFEPRGTFYEPEGVTIIVTHQQAGENGLPFDTLWAHITLAVHSSLSAVGFLAAITGKLAQAGISVNPVAGYYHDHLFVPWERRWQAMVELKELARLNTD